MAKIVSRPPAEDTGLQKATDRLTEILSKYTNGAIGKGVGSITAPKDFEEAAAAIDLALKLSISAIVSLKGEVMLLDAERLMLAERLDKTLGALDTFMDIGYDESLDKATDELFQTVESYGFGQTDAQGRLSFHQDMSFTKGDLKPLLQSLIEAWVEQKIKSLP